MPATRTSSWPSSDVDPEPSVGGARGPFPVTGRVPVHPGEERTVAVDRLHAKYADQVSGSLADWKRDAYIVALDR